MKAKTINETLNERGYDLKKPVKTTIDEFLTWYTGDEDWAKDWQTTNTMTVGGIHAQDDGEDGMSHLDHLYKNKDTFITVRSYEGDNHDYDLDFVFDDLNYSVQSMSPAPEDIAIDEPSMSNEEAAEELRNERREENTPYEAQEVDPTIKKKRRKSKLTYDQKHYGSERSFSGGRESNAWRGSNPTNK